MEDWDGAQKLNDPMWLQQIAWVHLPRSSSQKVSGLMGDLHFRIGMEVVVGSQEPERLVDKMDLW